MKMFLQEKKNIRFAVILFSIALILEIFVFNFNAFHLFGGHYTKTKLDLNNANITGFEKSGETLIAPPDSEAIIEFTDLKIPVGTINLESETETKLLEVSVDFSDATNASYRYGLVKNTLVKDNTDSNIIICRFSGDVNYFRVYIGNTGDSEFKLSGVTVNTSVPFRFSSLRFMMIFLTGSFVYIMTTYSGMKKKLCENLKPARMTAWGLTGVCLFISLAMVMQTRRVNESTFKNEFTLESGNQITQSLVDMMKEGKVTIIDDPQNEHLQKLASLDNPYDWSQRNEAGYNGPWDHLYFDGKIYSYYGIAPVITLFLPYHLLTGYYFPPVWAVWLYGAIGIIFLTKLYMVFMNKFFPKLPTGIILAGLLIMQVSSGVWYCFPSPNFYEIAQNSGFAAVTSGVYFLFASNIIGGGKRSYWRLALATAFLSLAVLCRPTLALYAIVAVMMIAFGFIKMQKEFKISKTESETSEDSALIKEVKFKTVTFLVCALVPFIIFGGIQMVYNYMRFGSFFEFGIRYTLTIYDYLNIQYHTRFASIGFYNYLFLPPQITPNFPFFHSAHEGFNTNGYYFIATRTGVGLIFRALPMFAYLYAGKALKLLPKENRYPTVAVFIAGCLITPFIIIFSIWQYGYGVRYCVDFGWQMLLGAYCIAFMVYNSIKSETLKKNLYNLFILSAVLACFVNFASVYSNYSGALSGIAHEFKSFERIFEFWR